MGDGWLETASSQAQGDRLDSNGLSGSGRLYITELGVCLVRFLAVTGGDWRFFMSRRVLSNAGFLFVVVVFLVGVIT